MPQRPDRRKAGRVVVVALLAVAGGAVSVSGQTSGASSPPPTHPDKRIVEQAVQQAAIVRNPLIVALSDQETLPNDRRAAVAQLLENKQFEVLKRAIDAGERPIIAAIFQTFVEIDGRPPEPLVEPTIQYIQTHGADTHTMAVRALAGVRSKPAITPVVALLEIDDAPQPLIDEALATLVEQTGREDLDAPEAWIAWWEEARWLPPREWEAMQAAAHAERARRLHRESARQFARILELHRQMYSLMPQDQRSALLATMMDDDEQAIRLLGFELAELALLNTQRLDDQVREASVDRLTDAVPEVRAAAASLLFRLGAGDETVDAVRRALRRETDAHAAASMLNYLRRRPSEADLAICLEWLDGAEPAATAAARTLLSRATDGVLSKPRERSQALLSLRAMESSRLTPGKIALLGMIGDSTDRQRLEGFLGPHTEQPVRRAAATALVRWPASVTPIAGAVRHDPTQLPVLTDALILHRATPAGYQLLREASAEIAEETRSPHLLRLRRAMPPAAALGSIGHDESKIEALESVLFETDINGLANRDPRYVLTQALILARYDAGDDSGALNLFDRIDPGMIESLSDEVRTKRRRALITMGRFDEAIRCGVDEADWRAALERSRNAGASETADSISAQIADLFPADSVNPAPDGVVTSKDGSDRDRKPGSGDGDDLEGIQNDAVTLEPTSDSDSESGGQP